MLSEYIDFTVHLAELAAAEIRKHFRAQFEIDNKADSSHYDPVTIADRNAEAVMRAEIERVYPTHCILGEEHGLRQGTSSLTWVLDPIDGTRAFVLGQLHWGTLIALSDAGEPILGLMHQPFTRETFIGSARGGELRHEGRSRALIARKNTRLRDATICATAPSMFVTPEQRAAFDRVVSRARSVRFGGDCYTPCMVAAGFADLVIERGLKAWDVQPLIPIVESAGGVITDWAGNSARTADAVVISSHAGLHEEVLAALNSGSD